MNKKQILTLAIIFIILASGLVAKHFAEKMSVDTVTEVYVSLPFSFDPAKIRKIQISRGPEAASVNLEKRNGQWIIQSLWDAKADREKVEDLLSALLP